MRQKLGSQAQVVKLGPETDYGLFAPTEPGSKSGTWLDLSLQIEDYMEEGKPVVLKSGVSCNIIYEKRGTLPGAPLLFFAFSSPYTDFPDGS